MIQFKKVEFKDFKHFVNTINIQFAVKQNKDTLDVIKRSFQFKQSLFI